MRGEIRLGHAEREHVHRHVFLPGPQRRLGDTIDLVAHRVGHGEAAGRGAAAVHQNEGSVARLRPVEDVGEAEVQRARPAPGEVQLARGDRVEALGRLAVALAAARACPDQWQME